MKAFYRNWLTALFVLTLAANCYATKGIFWQINKPGVSPSYLLGTIHSEDPRVTELPFVVNSRFEEAESVSLELLMDMSTMRKSTNTLFLKGNQTLDQLIDHALFIQIVEALRQYHIPPMLAKRLKPWAVIAMLNTPPAKTGKFLDFLLYRKAQRLQIRTYGLETIEEQLAIFEELTLDEQVIMLKETLKQRDEMPQLFKQLHDLYLQRDLAVLMKFAVKYMRDSSENKALANAFYKRLLDDRNIKMVERMEERLQEGNAFIAVGALHLPGEKGLLKLLQARGYQVFALH